MKLSQLHPNEGQIKGVPSNPRTITEDDFAKLKKSLRNFRKMLALRPMVVDEDFNILGGNMRYQALCRLAEEGAKIGAFVFTDEIPDEWVHQDCTLTEKEKREFVIKDNQERGQNDWDKLANEWSAEELKEWDVEAANWEQKEDDEEDEYEQRKREFEERMANGEISEEDEEYQEFLQKFELKKTTDDCYTPQLVYDAIADWVANEYGVDKKNFVRPFYPCGDYQNEKYKSTDIVVDNPPFSIMAEILQFYTKNNIRFFLFAPHLTLFSSSSSSSAIVVGVPITYENGAVVNTSFLTNIHGIEPRFKSCPALYKAVNDANNENQRQLKRQLPKYSYDHHIITTPFLSALSRLGIEFECSRAESEAISQLESQKASGKAIFGKGYIVSDRVFAEREKAEREKAEREKAEREKAERWELSDKERAIIERLNKAVKQ